MKILHVLYADGSTLLTPNAKMPTLEVMQSTVGGDVEYVAVLYKNKRTYMVVNEMGAMAVHGRPPLPVNKAATEIYHAASRARGLDWAGPPEIHGDVLLLEGYRIS